MTYLGEPKPQEPTNKTKPPHTSDDKEYWMEEIVITDQKDAAAKKDATGQRNAAAKKDATGQKDAAAPKDAVAKKYGSSKRCDCSKRGGC